MSLSLRRSLFAAAFSVLLFGTILRAQNTRTWTGLAAPDNNWTTLGNWNTGVPVSSDTALFNGSGNGNTSISLGAATQPINTIRFDGASATPYTIGVLNSGDKFNFDAGGQINVANNIGVLQTINAALQSSGALTVSNAGTVGLSLGGPITLGNNGTLTVNNALSATNTTLGGNIAENVGSIGSLNLQLNTTSGIVINGANSYTGPTTIQVNANSPTIFLGTNSPFGTGTVSIILASSVAPQFVALNTNRTIANAIHLRSGFTFGAGANLSLNGPITVINVTAGGTRTLTNATGFSTATFGDSAVPSTITLGHPIASGGDGIGKTLIVTPVDATYVFNDVLQDPAAGGGAASGGVQYGGTGTSTIQINSQSTYSGNATLNGVSTIKINNSSNAGGTAGPLGSGTLVFNSGFNNILQPIGGDRTVSNPVSMQFGFTVANAIGDTSGLTLSGPITMQSVGRFIHNNFSAGGGTLTLGSAAAPSSTLTLPTSGGQVLTIDGAGSTVINDVIQNPTPAPSPAPSLQVATTGPLRFNGLSTYTGDTSLSGGGTIRIGVSSNATPGPSFTAGPFGTGTLQLNTTPTFQPIGANRSISNPINMTVGFMVSNPTLAEDPTGVHNLEISGPITLGATGRNITNNMAAGASLTLGSPLSPSTISLGSTLTFQTLTGSTAPTIVNDTVTGVGGITVQGGAFVQMNGTDTYAGATTVTGAGSQLRINGTKSGTGAVTVGASTTLSGNGSIAGAITNNGTIDPFSGAADRTLTAGSSVSMGANSRLKIDLSGSLADKLEVSGNLNLSSVDFLDVVGGAGTGSWVIASYGGTLTGTFNTVTPGYTVNHGAGTNSLITLTKLATLINGDFNNDGKVDAGDFVTWRKNNGTNNSLPNDNGLGTPVGPSHYTLWRANFGNPPGSGVDTLENSAAVPEPATFLLVLVAIAGATLASARRRVEC